MAIAISKTSPIDGRDRYLGRHRQFPKSVSGLSPVKTPARSFGLPERAGEKNKKARRSRAF
jgi:hypothetical protein